MLRACTVAVVLLASGAVASGQLGVPVLVDRPAGSVTRALEWVDAVLTHVPGQRDDALRRVASWSPDAVRNLEVEAASIRRLMRNPDTDGFQLPADFGRQGGSEIRYSGRDRTRLKETAARIQRDGLSDEDLAARGVLLHTDIAVLAEGSGRILRHADGRRLDYDEAVADHWRASRAFANAIERNGARRADLTLWARASLAWLIAIHQWNAAHAEYAVDNFGDDADVRFRAGCLHEMLAAPQTQAFVQGGGLPAGFRPRVGSRADELDDAASSLKRALDLEPRHTEARLHYGRVLTLIGRAAAAVAELQRAAGEALEPEQRYYAQLFLGAALEAAGQRTGARNAYESAASLFPHAQAPRLALSHLAFTRGERREATAALGTLLAEPAEVESRYDPWWDYLTSPGRNVEQLLTEARERLAAPRSKP